MKVGNDQEMAQSERTMISTPKTEVGKNYIKTTSYKQFHTVKIQYLLMLK